MIVLHVSQGPKSANREPNQCISVYPSHLCGWVFLGLVLVLMAIISFLYQGSPNTVELLSYRLVDSRLHHVFSTGLTDLPLTL